MKKPKCLRLNLITTILTCSILALLTACDSGTSPKKPETIILPNEYTGSFYIIFNVANGQETESENETIVYRIPENGILLASSTENEGWINSKHLKYYYQNNDGSLKQITARWTTSFEDNQENRTENTTTIFGGGIGVFKHKDIPCEISYKSYYVGTKAEALDKINHFDIEEIPQLKDIDCSAMKKINPEYFN